MADAHDPIEGYWQPWKAELDGEAAPVMALEKMRLTLRGGRYEVRFGAEITDRGTYCVVLAADGPLRVTLNGEHGPQAGRTLAAIAQCVHDRLRVCYGLDGVEPGQFATSNGSQRYLVFYRRIVASGA